MCLLWWCCGDVAMLFVVFYQTIEVKPDSQTHQTQLTLNLSNVSIHWQISHNVHCSSCSGLLPLQSTSNKAPSYFAVSGLFCCTNWGLTQVYASCFSVKLDLMESVHLYANTNEYFGEVHHAGIEWMAYNDFMGFILLTNRVKGIYEEKQESLLLTWAL